MTNTEQVRTSDKNNLKFRLPRKIKKALCNQYLFYPPEADKSRRMANPAHSQEEYDDFKRGLLTPLFSMTKKEQKIRQDEFKISYCQPIEVDDELLQEMVKDVFAEQYRDKALSMLLGAKNNPDKVKDYHIFINAYNLGENGIAAMCYSGLEGGW